VSLVRVLNSGLLSARAAGFILAVAVLPLFGSSSKAECGDYVHIASHDGGPTAAKTAPDHPPATPDCPCRGTGCSKAPEHAPLLPVTAPTTPVEQPVCADLDAATPDCHTSGIVPPDSSFWPSGYPSGLERPPRA
jgi:hypothetical protein